jgi:choline-sulfatase
VKRAALALCVTAVVTLAIIAATMRERPSSLPATVPAHEDAAPPAADAEIVRRAPREPPPLNVVLITIDTLRWDLGYMGYPRPITPCLDALAARAVVFERAYATASYTPKSLGPLLIGKYASETHRDREHYTTFYPVNVFVTERLKEAGYRTLGVMGHHYFKWKTGFEQGFDVWDTSTVSAQARDDDPSVTSDRLTDVAIRLLEAETGQQPFFAWVHYLDPHAPYVPHEGAPDLGPTAQNGHPQRMAYDDEVRFTDEHVGRLLDFVDGQGWASKTAIIVTADHGEAFGERGFVRHGRELWESIVRVPLIVYLPGAPARRVKVKRSHIDLVPTLLDLAAVPMPSDGSLRGTSLLADVDADADSELAERDVYLDMPGGPFNEARRALITGPTPGVKAIDFGLDRYEVFDLATDVFEPKPVIDPSVRREAIGKLTRMRRALVELPAAP